MNRISRPNRNQQSSLSTITYIILLLTLVVAIGMPLLQSQYIYPRFVNLIIENTENEAIRVGRNMMRVVLSDYSDETLAIPEATKIYLDQASQDYDLWKVKIFAANGEVIYSTAEKDMGKINTHSYFHEIVAKGRVYTKVVQKNTESLEHQIVSNSVVETYIPILKEGKFIGAFELYYNISVRKETMDKIISRTNLILYGLTGIIVIVVFGAAIGLRRGMKERKRLDDTLYTLATRDGLTGIYNRRRFIELLQWEVKKYLRYQKNTSLLIFDVDHFKNVNDTYGHQAGDDVLVALTKTCQRIMRKSDLVARYGGEEFVLLLPETEQADAVEFAERLRHAVEELVTPCADGEIQVTISVGVTDFNNVEDLSLDSAVKLADDCLYKAKKMGRNKVCAI